MHVKIAPYHSSSNGAIERFNKSLLTILRGLHAKGGEWDKHLAKTIQVYNDTLLKEIKMTPNNYILSNKFAKSRTLHVSKHISDTWKQGNPKFSPFKNNDLVLYKVTFQGNLVTNKFQNRFVGPFRIVSVDYKGLSYNIQREINGSIETKKAHYDQLRLFRLPPYYIRSHPKFLSYYETILESMNKSIPKPNPDPLPPSNHPEFSDVFGSADLEQDQESETDSSHDEDANFGTKLFCF